MDRIRIAEHAGFCFGVTKAVDTAYRELERASQEGCSLYCLGSLIHNRQVTEELAQSGLVTIASVAEVPEGARVLIRAHGEPDITYRQGAEKGIELIDATCPLVAKIHSIARQAGEDGRLLLVVGNAKPPEVKGILGSTAGKAFAAEGAK